MSSARAKGAGDRGGSSMQELYFQLSAASAEDARLRAQLDQLRAKERRILAILETMAQQMSRLKAEIDARQAAANAHSGKQPAGPGYGASAFEVTELRY